MRIALSFLAFIVGGLWSLIAGSKPPSKVRGTASWYGESYRGKTMANGQPFNPDALTCAAWNWPLGTVLAIRYNSPRGYTRGVIVTVTDRGPDKRLNRIVDLSSRAFRHLVGSLDDGVIEVEVSVVEGRAP